MSRRYNPDGTLLLTALAGRIDALERTGAETAKDISAIGRGLTDITNQLRSITNLGNPATAAPAGNGGGEEPPETQPDWLDVEDVKVAMACIALAQRFIDTVLVHHGVGMTMPCWPLHPTVVSDLLSLAVERAAAYNGPSPTPVSEWLTRWLPAGIDRIGRAMADCNVERGHRVGGRPYDVTGFDPASAAVWWARDRHVPVVTAFQLSPL